MRRGLHALVEALGPQLAQPLRVASLYRGAPVLRAGSPRQGDYTNTVALGRIDAGLSAAGAEDTARRLLGLAKSLERRAGRALDPRSLASRPEERRDAPRPLDIDLLLLGDHVLALGALGEGREIGPSRFASGDEPAEPWPAEPWPGAIEVPHPRLRERRFVLEPLAEIAPDLPVPGDGATAGATVAELLAQLGEPSNAAPPLVRLAAGSPFGDFLHVEGFESESAEERAGAGRAVDRNTV